MVVAEHGETIRHAVQQEGLVELLNESQYLVNGHLDDPVVSDCALIVKKVHALYFLGLVNETIFVVDGEVPSTEQLQPIQIFVGNGDYLIANNNGKHFNPNEPVMGDDTFTIKAIHKLCFSGVANETIFVVDGEVPSAQQIEAIQEFIDSDNYLIVDNDGKHFNASEPVMSDNNYTIKQAKSLEIIVDGSVSEDDIKDIISVISDGNVIVRVIASDNEDGTTRLVIVVDDDHSDDIYDRLISCKSL